MNKGLWSIYRIKALPSHHSSWDSFGSCQYACFGSWLGGILCATDVSMYFKLLMWWTLKHLVVACWRKSTFTFLSKRHYKFKEFLDQARRDVLRNKNKKNCDGKKLWSLKDLPLVSFVRRRINARAAALMMRAWWQKPFLPKSSNISRTHFSFSGQKQIYRWHDSFPCTWVFIGSTDIFSESSISWKSKIWKENNYISGEHITSDEKNFSRSCVQLCRLTYRRR